MNCRMENRCKLAKCPVVGFSFIKNGTSLQVLGMTSLSRKEKLQFAATRKRSIKLIWWYNEDVLLEYTNLIACSCDNGMI